MIDTYSKLVKICYGGVASKKTRRMGYELLGKLEQILEPEILAEIEGSLKIDPDGKRGGFLVNRSQLYQKTVVLRDKYSHS